jgi:hypothetical protein
LPKKTTKKKKHYQNRKHIMKKNSKENSKKWKGTHLCYSKVWCSKFKALTCTSQEGGEVPY